jgi:hypothetical protein
MADQEMHLFGGVGFMNIQTIANLSLFPIGVVCTINAIRAFYMYTLSRNDILFILGFAMSSIAMAVFMSNIGDAHLVPYNTQWARYMCSSSGALCIFLSSIVKSHEQLGQLKRGQVILGAMAVMVIALTPILPPFASPLIPATLNNIRTVIYGAALIRYASLYILKESRFSLIMSFAFLLLVTGFILVTPQLLHPDPTTATLNIIASFVRVVGYSLLLVAYSFG